MSPEEKLRLSHILKAAATLIAGYVNGVSKEAFLSDPMRQDAVMRRIQIIGEQLDICRINFWRLFLISPQRKPEECATSSFTTMTE